MNGIDGIEYNLNEAISDLAKKTNYQPLYKRKWFIGLIIGGSLFIVILIILLVVLLGKGKDEEKIKAEIKCQYVISPSEKKS